MQFLALLFVNWAIVTSAMQVATPQPLAAPDPAAPVIEAAMPLRILRDAGEPPRMAEPALQVGRGANDALHQATFGFNSDGAALGPPKGAGITVKFGAYCRDRDSWVEAVLIAPSGQRWTGHRVWVPAGPDRGQDWSSGYIDTPELQEAVASGGRFTLALQDDTGRLWHEVTIDTLTPARRAQLFEANLEAFRATDPATVRPASDMLVVRELAPPPLPWPPRPCPAA